MKSMMKPTSSLTGQFFLFRFYAFPQQKLTITVSVTHWKDPTALIAVGRCAAMESASRVKQVGAAIARKFAILTVFVIRQRSRAVVLIVRMVVATITVSVNLGKGPVGIARIEHKKAV